MPEPAPPPPGAPEPTVSLPEKRPPAPAIPAERQALQQTLEPEREAPWRMAGEVLHTYIVCESEDGCVYLIDKHAAHERINFDRLKSSLEPPMRQALLRPCLLYTSPSPRD